MVGTGERRRHGTDDGAAPPATSGRGVDRWFVWAVGGITLVAAVLRLAYILFDRRHIEYGGDAFYYSQGANLFADGEGFIHPFGWVDGQRIESADHPPLYILYLAGWSFVGVRSTTGHLLASALLGIASVVVAAVVGRRVAGERAGVIAAALVALYPNVWRYDGMLMSETVVILAVLVIVWLAYRYWDHRTPGRLVAVGAAIGIATLSRSELLLLVPLLLVPLALLAQERSWRWRVGWLAAAGATLLAMLAPWLVYNQMRFEEPVLLSQNLGGTLAVSYCDPVYRGELIGYWHFFCGPEVLEREGITVLADPQSDRILREAGLTYAREHLDELPKVVAARLGRITGLFRPLQQRDLDATLEGTTWWVATAGMVTLPFMAVGAVAGAVVLRRRRQFLLPLVAPIACVLVTVALFYAATRFRATAEGPMCILAAVALDAAWRWWRARRAGVAPAEPPEPAVAAG